jgi:GNAT superfamily N-acetyltransferase
MRTAAWYLQPKQEWYTQIIMERLDKNLFMMCPHLRPEACRDLPDGYYIRNCRRGELEIWKAIHFDDPVEAREHHEYMTGFFERVYAPYGDLFFEKCLFVCGADDVPIGTGFIWRAYGAITTLHWLKVVKAYEGRGIGRALLSVMLSGLTKNEYPVYLHTQPESYRAIKLYSDFGFALLTDPYIGKRKNDLEASIPYLAEHMPNREYEKLKTAKAPGEFLRRLAREDDAQF